MSLQAKLDKRANLVKEQRAIIDKAKAEGRELNADEQTKYEALEADFDKVQGEIRTFEMDARIAQREKDLDEGRGGRYSPTRLNLEEDKGEHFSKRSSYKDAFFGAYARMGRNNLGPDRMAALQEGTDSEGGYIVPEEFETRLFELMQEMDPVRQLATVITTRSDRNIPLETDDGDFAYIAEEGSYTEDDPAFGRVVLSAFKSGGIVKVSEELLQDAFFNLETYLLGLASRRFNRLEETNFAGGNGSSKPLGLFATTAVGGVSVTGYQGAVSGTAVITGDDLIETFHALGRSYRANASWLTSDAMVKMIRKLKDGENNYIWQPGLQAGQPDRIFNRPVYVSEGATAPAAAAKSIIFGDISYYYIGDRLGMTMQRLGELFAATGQVGFKFTKRNDGRLVDPNAITFFQHGAAS